MDSTTGAATRKFSNLFDLVEGRGCASPIAFWWGPVIGTDEGTAPLIGADEDPRDADILNLVESLVQDEIDTPRTCD